MKILCSDSAQNVLAIMNIVMNIYGEDLKNKPGFDLKEGDKIVSLVSLSMTPLKIEKILAIHKDICLLYTSSFTSYFFT